MRICISLKGKFCWGIVEEPHRPSSLSYWRLLGEQWSNSTPCRWMHAGAKQLQQNVVGSTRNLAKCCASPQNLWTPGISSGAGISRRDWTFDGSGFLCRELVCITVKWTWYNGRDICFHITSGRINMWKGVNQLKELFFLNLIFFFYNTYLKLTNRRYFVIKTPLFFTINNKNGVLL